MTDRMSRSKAIAGAQAYFDDGRFLADLGRRIAIPSSSQEPERAGALGLLARTRNCDAAAEIGKKAAVVKVGLRAGDSFAAAHAIRHSAVRPAASTILCHFALSSATNFVNASTDMVVGTPPSSANRATIF